MKVSELRIGNWIQDEYTKEVFVSARLIYNLVEGLGYLAEWQPIPLTEQWLVRFGFRYEFHSYKLGCIELLLDIETNTWYAYYGNDGDNDIKIHYTHQLQNLYFALTGEELALK